MPDKCVFFKNPVEPKRCPKGTQDIRGPRVRRHIMEFINLDEPLFTFEGIEDSDIVAIQKDIHESIPEYKNFVNKYKSGLGFSTWYSRHIKKNIFHLGGTLLNKIERFYSTLDNFRFDTSQVELFKNFPNEEYVHRFNTETRLIKLEEEVKNLRMLMKIHDKSKAE